MEGLAWLRLLFNCGFSTHNKKIINKTIFNFMMNIYTLLSVIFVVFVVGVVVANKMRFNPVKH